MTEGYQCNKCHKFFSKKEYNQQNIISKKNTTTTYDFRLSFRSLFGSSDDEELDQAVMDIHLCTTCLQLFNRWLELEGMSNTS